MDKHPEIETMRLVVGDLCASPKPIHARLQAAEQHFSHVNNVWPSDSAEWNLFHRIASSLVAGGAESDTVAESIAALDEAQAVSIARDMLHLFELLAGIPENDARW